MSEYKWSNLNTLELSKYAENFCKMKFMLKNFEVYTPEIDDRGVDFIVRQKDGIFLEVQVKSIRKTKYVYIPKDKIKLDKNHLVCLVVFNEDEAPKLYVIPATVWKSTNKVFVDHPYDKPGQSSAPEWGINYSQKNSQILDKYLGDKFFDKF